MAEESKADYAPLFDRWHKLVISQGQAIWECCDRYYWGPTGPIGHAGGRARERETRLIPPKVFSKKKAIVIEIQFTTSIHVQDDFDAVVGCIGHSTERGQLGIERYVEPHPRTGHAGSITVCCHEETQLYKAILAKSAVPAGNP